MPAISVIVPVYQVEPYLRRCVDSILAQSFQDFELILVDDGSPDRCPGICDEYAGRDGRVHVLHRENGGLSAARNAGIDWAFAHSDSQWLTMVDSDDWIHPMTLEALYTAALDLNVPVSICGYAETNGEQPVLPPEDCPAVLFTAEEFYLKHCVNATVAWGKLYRKSCFSGIRYPVGRIHEDEYVTYRILFSCPRLGVIQAPYYAYFRNPAGITKGGWTPKRMDAHAAYEAQIAFFSKHGYEAVRRFRIRGYVENILWQISLIQKSPEGDFSKKYQSLLEHKARRLLAIYGKEHIFTISQDAWIFERLYPHGMRLYRLVHRTLRKRSGREEHA